MAERAGRRTAPASPKRPKKKPKRAGDRPRVLGVEVRSADWMPRAATLSEGAAGDWVRVPAGDAQRLLRDTARLVADLPKGSNQSVVWVAGASEVLVHMDGITLKANTGLVTLGIPVDCEQLEKTAVVTVPLALGSEKNPRGLFMSTFDTPGGPAVVTDAWGGTADSVRLGGVADAGPAAVPGSGQRQSWAPAGARCWPHAALRLVRVTNRPTPGP